jgi:hypothetical protein
MRGSARKVLVSAACVLGLAATAAPVLTLAAASPAMAAAPSSAAGSGLPTPGIYHAPILGKVVTSVLGQLLGGNSVRHATDVTSSNWSGYADGNDTYNSVAASWTEPTVNCGSSGGGGGILGGLLGGEGLGDLIGPSGSAGSFWVGIDGYTSSSVEQLGTDADCNGSTPDYYAWWEMYPNPSDVITTSSAYPVHPGDQMTAWVVSNPSGTSFYLSEKDTTAGWTFSTTQTASGFARSSAEVVAEAPSSCSLLFCSEVPLSNFGQVSFTGADVIDNSGNNGPLSSYAANQITMSSNGKTLAVPSNLSSDGRSFSISWQNS